MDKEKKGRQYQDTVFRMYFNEETRLKEVAGALHGRSYAEEPLQIVTLEGTFLSRIKNDISFLLAGRHLIFMEHQSTANQNMPLRCLYYVCEQLRQYIPAKKLYQNTPIKLPAPEFHVFYTGAKLLPEESVMRLSEAYRADEASVYMELIVTVHNVAYDAQKKLLLGCRALHDYTFFVDSIKQNIAAGMERADAIRAAMRYCIERDIMRAFLEQHKREVIDMVNFEWNQELFEEAKFEEGRVEGKVEMILGMLREKMPLETIAKISNLSLDRIRELGRVHSLL